MVTNADTGEPLPAVNVVVKGTTIGTSTNAQGRYSLSVPSLQDTLVFTFIGFETKEVPIVGRTVVDVALESSVLEAEEVVVTAFGQEEEKDEVTGAVSSISGDEIEKVPVTTVGNALLGKITGLQSVQISGLPGANGAQIFVRGISTLSAGESGPLFVLDGIVMRGKRAIMQLDPSNIKSITVLKDAASTAVYGVEGANGVIVVKTKMGQAGQMNVSVNTSVGLQTPTVWQQYADSYLYAKAYNQAQLLDGVPADQLRFSDEALKALRTGSNPLIYPSLDVIDYITNPTALLSRTNVSISGGTEAVQYYMALGYLWQDGFMKSFEPDARYTARVESNPSYERYNLRANLNIDVTPSTQIRIRTAGRVGSRITVDGQNWGLLYSMPPFSSAGLVDGKVIVSGNRYIPGPRWNNFARYVGNGHNRIIRSVFNLMVAGRQQLDVITPGLSVQLKGAYNAYFNQTKEFFTNVPIYVPFFRTDVFPSADGDSTIVFKRQQVNRISNYREQQSRDRDWYWELRLNYNHSFGPHGVNGLLLYSQRRRYYPNQYTGIPRGLVSTVGRVKYNYDDRYLLEVSASLNGSENFAEGRRFGLFPAVSAGWIITNEPYMPELPWLGFLKLRASYGIVGSDKGVGRFLYLPGEYDARCQGYYFGYQVPQRRPGACERGLGNPGVTWEKAYKQNYGINMRLFGRKLTLRFDYFYEKRTGILIRRNTVPPYMAVGLPPVNLGRVQNKGYEFKIRWRQQIGDFFYSVGANVTHARNKVLFTDEVPRPEPYMRRTGESVGQRFGWIFDSYYTKEEIQNFGNGVPEPAWEVKPGYLQFKDLNGDGIIDRNDKAPIGYPERVPEYVFGSNTRIRYKNINFHMTWAAVTNHSEMLQSAPYRYPFGQRGDRSMKMWYWEGRWTPEKDPEEIIYPRLTIEDAGIRFQHNSDFWMADASYIRLKTIGVGYTFNGSFIENLGAQRLRVYANAYNVLTFAPMLDKYNIDPEAGGRIAELRYPVMEKYSVGIELDF